MPRSISEYLGGGNQGSPSKSKQEVSSGKPDEYRIYNKSDDDFNSIHFSKSDEQAISETKEDNSTKGTFADKEKMQTDVFGGMFNGEDGLGDLAVGRLCQLGLDIASLVYYGPTGRAVLVGGSAVLGAYLDKYDPDVTTGDWWRNVGMNVGSYAFTNMKIASMGKYLPKVLNLLQKYTVASQFEPAVRTIGVFYDAIQQDEVGITEYLKTHIKPEDLQAMVNMAGGLQGQIGNYRANKKADFSMAENSQVSKQYVTAVDSRGQKKTVEIGKNDYDQMVGKTLDEQNAYIKSKYSDDVKLVEGVSGVSKSNRVNNEGTFWEQTKHKVGNFLDPRKYGTNPRQSNLNNDTEFVNPNLRSKGDYREGGTYDRADAKVEKHNKSVESRNKDAVKLSEKNHSVGTYSHSGEVEMYNVNGNLMVKSPDGSGNMIPLKDGMGYGFSGDQLVGSPSGRNANAEVRYHTDKRTVTEKDSAGNDIQVEKEFVVPEITIDGKKVKIPDNLTEEQRNEYIRLIERFFRVSLKNGGSIRRFAPGGSMNDLTWQQIQDYNDYVVNHPWQIQQDNIGAEGREGGVVRANNKESGYHGFYINQLLDSQDFKNRFPWFEGVMNRNDLKKFYNNHVNVGEYGSLPYINTVHNSDTDPESYNASMHIPTWTKDGNVEALGENPIYSWSNKNTSNTSGQSQAVDNQPAVIGAPSSTANNAAENGVSQDNNKPVSQNPAVENNAVSNAPETGVKKEDAAVSTKQETTKSVTEPEQPAKTTTAPVSTSVVDESANSKTPEAEIKKDGSDSASASVGGSESSSTTGDGKVADSVKGEDVDAVANLMSLYGAGDATKYKNPNASYYGRSGGYWPWDITRPLPAAAGANAVTYQNAEMAKRYNVVTYNDNDKLKTARLSGNLGAVNSAYEDLNNTRNQMSDYVSTDMDKNMNSMYSISDKGSQAISRAYATDRDAFQKSEENALATVDANRNSMISTGNANQKIANDEITRRNKIDYNARASAHYNMYDALETTKDRYAKTKTAFDTLYGPTQLASLMQDWKRNATLASANIENAIRDHLRTQLKSNGISTRTNEELERDVANVMKLVNTGQAIPDDYYLDYDTKINGRGLDSAISSYRKYYDQYRDPNYAQMMFMRNMTSRFPGAFNVDPLRQTYKQ